MTTDNEAGSSEPPAPADGERFLLKLFVAGMTPRSTRAIATVRALCEEHLNGRYDLEVIDIYEHPHVAKEEQIVAVPTLVKKLPEPIRRFIGDLSSGERLLVGLNVQRGAES